MNVTLLIDAIVRQTTALIAHLPTRSSPSWRANSKPPSATAGCAFRLLARRPDLPALFRLLAARIAPGPAMGRRWG